jgi:hypothetical protein
LWKKDKKVKKRQCGKKKQMWKNSKCGKKANLKKGPAVLHLIKQ